MTDPVPADFPFVPRASSLSGAQLKFSVLRDRDGKFREAGASHLDQERDFAFCMDAVAWGVDLLKLKIEKPKYASSTSEALLAKLKVNLDRDLGVPAVYQEWILNQVAKRLGWS